MASHRLARVAQWLGIAAAAAALAGALVVGGLYLYVAPGLPDVEQLQDIELQEPLRVYAASGELMGIYGSKRRFPVDIANVPETFRNAFIAAEDNRFYEHPGVDWMGIVRAAWHLVLTGEKTQGGSTITMQVARNFFLTREKTYIRKIREIFLALKIHSELSKAEVLELYVNKIYLGEGAYGIGAAAQAYYGKDVDELTLAEMATIAGLPRAPSRLDPIDHPKRARERRHYVLRQMHANDMIDAATLEAALAAPITATSHAAPVAVRASYAAEMARLEAVQRFGDDVDTRGYRVYTSIVPDEQAAAAKAVHDGLLAYERRHGFTGPVAQLDPARLPGVGRVRALLEAGGAGRRGEAHAGDAESGSRDAGEGGTTDTLGLDGLDAALAEAGRAGHLHPAVVLAVEPGGAVVYRRRRGLARLPWEHMQWAAPRREAGGKGPAPDRPADVVAVGDIVDVAPAVAGEVRLAQRPGVQGALVALDPHDGAIRALVGGFDFDRSEFNRVTQARRQPGSGFKPFIYSAALNKGFTPATLVNDAPVVFEAPALEDTWRPENYSGRIFGPTRLREGLVHSRNLVSIRVLRQIGVPYAIDHVGRFGFPAHRLPRNLTLALGTGSVTPLQMARGYAVFANVGYRVDPFLVTRIAERDDDVVYRANPAHVCPADCRGRRERAPRESPPADDAHRPPDETPLAEQQRSQELEAVGVPDRQEVAEARYAPRVLDARNAYIVRSFLRDVARRGTGRGTRALGRDDIGGKTGTTDDQRDAWFSGFNSSVAATAWVGYDDQRSLGERETGARAALPIWIDFMEVALAGTPETWPPMPNGMVTVKIDPGTGDYAGAGNGEAVFEMFRAGNAPEPGEPRAGAPQEPLF